MSWRRANKSGSLVFVLVLVVGTKSATGRPFGAPLVAANVRRRVTKVVCGQRLAREGGHLG